MLEYALVRATPFSVDNTLGVDTTLGVERATPMHLELITLTRVTDYTWN